MDSGASWQPLALRALLILPLAIVAVRTDLTKVRGWRARIKQWRDQGTAPSSEYRRDNKLWRWRFGALAICIAGLVACLLIISAQSAPQWVLWVVYAGAMMAAAAWNVLGLYVR